MCTVDFCTSKDRAAAPTPAAAISSQADIISSIPGVKTARPAIGSSTTRPNIKTSNGAGSLKTMAPEAIVSQTTPKISTCRSERLGWAWARGCNLGA